MGFVKRMTEALKNKKRLLSTIFKKKTSILTLNDDCLDSVFQYLNRAQLANVSSIRNYRIKFCGERMFRKNFGKSLKISNELIEENSLVCRSFGHMIVALDIEFQGNSKDVGVLIDFVERQVPCANIEELVLRNIAVNGEFGKATFRKAVWFLTGMNERFPKLKRLTIDHQSNSIGQYFLYMPLLPNLISLNITGTIFVVDHERVYNVLAGHDWQVSYKSEELSFTKRI